MNESNPQSSSKPAVIPSGESGSFPNQQKGLKVGRYYYRNKTSQVSDKSGLMHTVEMTATGRTYVRSANGQLTRNPPKKKKRGK
jgi:hypothetical protein